MTAGQSFRQKYHTLISIGGAMAAGVAVGVLGGEAAKQFEVLTKVFMWMIKALAPYLIFFAIASGILSIGSLERLKRLGLKAGALYLCTAFFAVFIGIAGGELIKPGAGFVVPAVGSAGAAAGGGGAAAPASVSETLLSSPLLTLVVMTLVLSVAALAAKDHYAKGLGEAQKGRPADSSARAKAEYTLKHYPIYINHIDNAFNVVNGCAKIIFYGVGFIVKLAPFAVFGAMAALFSTGNVLEKLTSYGLFMEAFFGTTIVQFVVLGALLLLVGKLNPLPFFRKVFPVQLMAFTTSSSKATLPVAMQELRENMGASENGANFILPLGAAINMDGTAIYLGLCSVFFAQAYAVDLSLTQYVMIAFASTLCSIGAAGLPGGSLIFMPMVFSLAGIPAEGMPVIIAVDRLLDMVRTTTNITGDCALALAIDASEGGLDREAYARTGGGSSKG